MLSVCLCFCLHSLRMVQCSQVAIKRAIDHACMSSAWLFAGRSTILSACACTLFRTYTNDIWADKVLALPVFACVACDHATLPCLQVPL